MKRPLIILALLGVGALGVGAVWATWRAMNPYGDNDANNPHGVFFVCGQCRHGFTLTMKQLARHHKGHWGEPVPCPRCGATDTRKGVVCSKCRTIFEHDRTAQQEHCPKCKAPVYPAAPTE